jgi:hypothetical protein
MEYTDEQLDALREESARVLETQPRIIKADLDGETLRFALQGGSVPHGVTLSVPASSLSDLRGATPGQLAAMKVTATGNAVHWPELDVQMSTIALLELLTGLQTLKSAQRRGGTARTRAKSAAARANGAKGGRPRKVALI